MLIDGHVHVTPSGKWFNTDHDASVGSLLSQMDQYGVSQALLLPINGFIPNDFVARVCALHPSRFIGAVSVDPGEGRKAIAQVRDYFSSSALKLLKLHPSLQSFDPLSKGVIRLLEVCAELNVPTLFDCFPFDRKGLLSASAPFVFDRLAKLIPSAKIILAHSGGHRVLDACMTAKSNPNIFLDISYSPVYFEGSSVMNDLIFTIRKVGAGRVIYGSDYPEVPIGRALSVARQLVHELPETDKDLLFGGALQQLLQLRESRQT